VLGAVIFILTFSSNPKLHMGILGGLAATIMFASPLMQIVRTILYWESRLCAARVVFWTQANPVNGFRSGQLCGHAARGPCLSLCQV
jgi:hypothetical protein